MQKTSQLLHHKPDRRILHYEYYDGRLFKEMERCKMDFEIVSVIVEALALLTVTLLTLIEYSLI